VKLNVGGKYFVTSPSTLHSKGDNFLTRLLEHKVSGKVPVLVDEYGYIFIDRNGKVFGCILEYLRTGVFEWPPQISRSSLLRELDFYQIPLPEPMCNANEFFALGTLPYKQKAREFFASHYEDFIGILKLLLMQGQDRIRINVGRTGDMLHGSKIEICSFYTLLESSVFVAEFINLWDKQSIQCQHFKDEYNGCHTLEFSVTPPKSRLQAEIVFLLTKLRASPIRVWGV